MTPVAKRKSSDDPRTVGVTHEDGRTDNVTPEAANALEHYGWTRDDTTGDPDVDKAVRAATAPLEARIADLEQQLAKAKADSNAGDEMPTTAAALIDWVGDDRARAGQALAAETNRSDPRKSVLEHIEALTLKGA